MTRFPRNSAPTPLPRPAKTRREHDGEAYETARVLAFKRSHDGTRALMKGLPTEEIAQLARRVARAWDDLADTAECLEEKGSRRPRR